MTTMEHKYQFLMRDTAFKTLDAPLITPLDLNPMVGSGSITPNNYLELNNKLIEDTYYLCKKREYVQLHMDEADMSVLDLNQVKPQIV